MVADIGRMVNAKMNLRCKIGFFPGERREKKENVKLIFMIMSDNI